MRTTHLLIPVVALITVGVLSAPASADQSRRRPAQTEGSAKAVRRGEQAKPAARPQEARPQQARPQEARSQDTRTQQARPQGARSQEARTQQARPQGARSQEARTQQARPQQARPQQTRPQDVRPQQARPQQVRPQSRAQAQDRRASGPRRDDNRRVEVRRDVGPRYVPRREVNRVYVVPPRAYRPAYRPVRPPRFVRSYFSFRPHLDIGFGLWIGYGVPYPYAYARGYAPRVYGSFGLVSGVSIYGGVSFNIAPYDALVFVDGYYVGRVDDFSPMSPPLTLTPGLHRIEVQAGGFQPMAWDVEIVPGQVIPYQGAMLRY